MIETARALHDALIAEIDIHNAAIARLQLALEAIEPLFDQPGREVVAVSPGGSAPAPASQPPAASTVALGRIDCPECGENVRARGLGVHRAKSKRHAEAISAKASQATSAAPTFEAPVVPFETKPVWQPRPVATGGEIPPPPDDAKRSYPCNRCSTPFPTREARDTHQGGCTYQAPPPLNRRQQQAADRALLEAAEA